MTAYSSADPVLPSSRKAALAGMIVGMAALAAALQFTVATTVQIERPLTFIPWWMIALLFLLVERYCVYFVSGNEGRGHALSELPMISGLAALSPEMLILARVSGVALHRVLTMRQAPLKLLFNIVLSWLEVTFLLTLLALMPGVLDLVDWRTWAVLLPALLLVDAGSSSLVAVAIGVATGQWQGFFDLREQLADSVSVLISAITAIILVIAFSVYPPSGLLGALLVGLLVFAHRQHRRMQSRYEALRHLARQMEDLVEAGKDSGWTAVLRQMTLSFNALHAELLVFNLEGARQSTRYRLGPRHSLIEESVEANSAEMRRYSRLTARGAAVVPADELPMRIESKMPMRAGMVAPISLHEQIAGVMLVAGKSVGEAGYSDSQLDQFTLFAQRVSRGIEQNRLVQRMHEETDTLRRQMLVDTLTGLPSESAFHEIIHRTRGEPAGIVLISLDDLTDVNRTVGRSAGDRIVKTFAVRLSKAVGREVQLFRHHGPRFIARIPGADSRTAVSMVEGWLGSIERVYQHEGMSLHVDAFAGIAIFPTDGDEPEALLELAQLGVEQARREHMPVAFYEARGGSDALLGLTLRGELAKAIRNGEIELFYQPRVSLRNGSTWGAEALARWKHAEHGYVRPDVFIRMAEESGLILDLSRLVLRKALSALSDWHAGGYPVNVSINLSAHDFRRPGLCEWVESQLREHGVAARFVTFEITETALMENIDQAAAIVRGLHDLGACISIDDFGTGYSSFAYLARLPLDEIKIDKSFVSHMSTRPADETVVETLIELGHKLDLTVVAEGVESGEVLERLAGSGCDQAQGYFIARPLERSAFEAFLADAWQ